LPWATILLLALGWRLLGIAETEVWRDEAISIIHTHDGWVELLTRLPYAEDTPPLFFILLKAWSSISDREGFLRLLSVTIGTVWVYVVMRTAALIHPRAVWSTGLLAAFSPLPIHYSQEIRVYALLGLLTALCFWMAQRMTIALIADPKPLPPGSGSPVFRSRPSGPRFWAFALAGTSALTAHCHATGIFVFPAVLCYAFGRVGWSRRRQVLAWSPLAVWIVAILPMVWFGRHWTAIHIAEGDWWVPPVCWQSVKNLAERLVGIHALTDFALMHQSCWRTWLGFALERVVIAGPCILFGLALIDRRRRSAALALLLAAGAFIGLLVVAGIVCLPSLLDRTALPAWTAIVLALGAGGAGLRSRATRAARGVVVLLVACVWATSWAWAIEAGPPRRTPSEQLFAWMRPHIGPHDLIYTTPRWFKDQTVYALRDTIAADQLLDESETYEGKPPRHRLEPVGRSDRQAHFVEKLGDHRARHGSDFSIWVVKYGRLTGSPGTPEAFLLSCCREVDRHTLVADRPLTAVRYELAQSPPPDAHATHFQKRTPFPQHPMN